MTAPARIHLVDGTFELFRCFHGAPRATNAAGHEVGAARGLLATLTALVHQPDVTHIAVAFDSVVAPPPSARSGKASDEQLISGQVALAAESVRALGVSVWPSGRYQADELIATAAAQYAAEPTVSQVVICSTDNDFNQCVRGDRVVVLDRVRKVVTDEAAVVQRYGVEPQQIPDLFALVGDRSDGLPGVPGWGLKSAAAVLRRYGSLENVPVDEAEWDVDVRGASRLAAALREWRDEALLCRDLSELRTDLPLRDTVAHLEWKGADRYRLEKLCEMLGDDSVIARIGRWRTYTRQMRPDEGDVVRSMILEGLREHWGTIDPALNHDLDNLSGVIPGRRVLVATDGVDLLGTATLVRRDDRTAEIVRMSVDSRHRRGGLGRLLVAGLVAAAKQWDVERVVLETTASWTEVVSFYERTGFTLTHFADSEFGRDAWFELKLAD